MKKSNFLSLILALAMAFTVLSGCASDDNGIKKPIDVLPSEDADVSDDTLVSEDTSDDNVEISYLDLAYVPLVDVTYPEMPKYPNEMELLENGDYEDFEKAYDEWRQARRYHQDIGEVGSGYENYLKATVADIFSDDSKSIVYSPTNVYMALGMLAELCDGESRQQILSLVGESDIESLRKSAYALWHGNYCDDGAVKSVLGSSVWVDEGVELIKSTADILAQNYYSEIYSCNVGSHAMIETYKAWLNEQTGGLLEDVIENTQIDPETIMVLATTVYFKAKWDTEFSEESNTTEKFTLSSGEEVDAEFMNQTVVYVNFFADEGFTAMNKPFNDGGSMWLILPDEGVAISELVKTDKFMNLLTKDGEGVESFRTKINLSLPKFDVTSDLELDKNLKNLGITDVFDATKADFSNLTSSVNGEIWLSKVKHAARVRVDEEGCEAAAYTEMMLAGNALPPQEEVFFKLNRPFVFAITGLDGTVLFIGTVQNPNADM